VQEKRPEYGIGLLTLAISVMILKARFHCIAVSRLNGTTGEVEWPQS